MLVSQKKGKRTIHSIYGFLKIGQIIGSTFLLMMISKSPSYMDGQDYKSLIIKWSFKKSHSVIVLSID
jgi:hypothetical protein